MDVTTRTQEEARRVIEVDGVEFYVEDLVQPLGWLRHGSVKDELVDSTVLNRMKEAGLVKKTGGPHPLMVSNEAPPEKWKQVDGKCSELFDQLNEPYYRLRPQVDRRETPTSFGVFDEQEDENARQRAERVAAELERRNPDVSFKVDEEELSSIRIRD